MFGNLFEEGEDFDFVSENKGINGRKSRKKEHEPPAPRAACNLSGIKNQGGTCYLNSLLQTLLYTPEFRESLFALRPEELGCLPDKDKPKSKVRVIPLELQRLFAQLLLADQLAASTTDLTDSFGWTGNEQTSQHDVQELNRILFSALECSLVGTSGHDLINRLYHGIVVNKIVCKECDNVSERQDIIYNRQEDFLDLTVTVKGVSGLEEALCNFYVEEEQFDNDNLYRCGRCEKLVKATKSAKLRHLPTFLTISLLRFNYDFVKSERYKETGCYTFPVRLAMQPFCEQDDLDDVEFEYELFSVIIHKGGCYGGHYHAYIKDIDQLGTWFSPDEENVVVDLTKDTTSKQGHKTSNVLDLGDPLETLRTILVQVGSDGLLVDQLGQKLLEKVGFAWNKRYRKQHGPLKKFLENHPSVFLLKANGTRVSVKQPANCCLEQQPNKSKAKKTPSGSGSAQLCNHDIHWFNFDDSQVRPIHEKDVEKQFQGKESAYMLFYRKSRLQRTAAAKGNPKYKVPLHLQEEMANYNTELQKQRMEFDSAVNNIEVHLHLGPEYKFVNGALHPASSQKDSVLTLTIDKRKTIGDLRQSAFQLLEFWEGDMVIHVAKQLPAGLHLYERFDGKPEFVEGVLSIITLFWPKQLAVGRTEDQASLCSLEVTDGAILFLWNGNQVHGVEVEAGQEVEPVLLQILLSTLRSKLDSGEVEFKELRQAFPRRMTLGALQETVVLSMGIPPEDLTICHRKTLKNKASSDWSAYASEDFHKTLEELSLKDNDSLLILDQKYSDPSVLSSNGMPVTVATLCDHSWVQIKNYRDEKMMQVEGTTVTIPVTVEMLVSEVKLYAIEKLKLKANLANDSCLRPIDQTGKLLPPVREDLTLRDTGLKTGSTLALCCGSAPTDNQLFLNFAVGDSANLSPEMGVIVEQKISVRECLKLMLEKAALPGEWWHLRKTDWCYEAGEVLKDEEASLAELKISTGETLLIMEGRLPPKGFLKLPVWLYQSTLDSKNRKYLEDEQGSFTDKLSALNISAARDNSLQHHLDTELVFMGDIEIAGEANLEDLKTQVLTLPSVQSLSVPSVKFLRVWLLESKCRTKILRNHQQQLSKFKLGSSVEIGIQLLQADEELTSTELLLQLRMAVPGERSYYTPEDFIFDTSKECTARTLRHKIAQVYSLTMEQIEIAKYFPEKSTWMPISSWSQQVSKKKRKKKPENLQGAPYHLKDGDIIGVKNLLIDKDKEFSTLTGDVVKQQHRLEGSKGDRSCQAPAHQSADGLNGKTARARRPEVALSISVADFR